MRCASRVAGGLVACAAVLPVVGVPTAGAAVSDLIHRPATVLSISPLENDMPTSCREWSAIPQHLYHGPLLCLHHLVGRARASERHHRNPRHTTSADNAIVFGYSNGAMVAEQWLKQHLTDPNRPSSAVLSFVVMGDPTRASGGSRRHPR